MHNNRRVNNSCSREKCEYVSMAFGMPRPRVANYKLEISLSVQRVVEGEKERGKERAEKR